MPVPRTNAGACALPAKSVSIARSVRVPFSNLTFDAVYDLLAPLLPGKSNVSATRSARVPIAKRSPTDSASGIFVCYAGLLRGFDDDTWQNHLTTLIRPFERRFVRRSLRHLAFSHVRADERVSPRVLAALQAVREGEGGWVVHEEKQPPALTAVVHPQYIGIEHCGAHGRRATAVYRHRALRPRDSRGGGGAARALCFRGARAVRRRI